MTPEPISTESDLHRRYLTVHDVPIAYVDVGEGRPIVFLHGNPTPSYLWREIIPYALPFGRCLAPDYPGMGNSGPAPDGGYRFVNQRRYVDAWFDQMELRKDVILVLHDWGSALGFDWARRNEGAVKAIVYMEGIVRPFRSWEEWPDATRAFFQAQRTEAGEALILEQNLFVEYLLRLRGISDEAISVYRSHWRVPGEARRPMLAWTRDLPIAGEPADVVEVVEDYARWLSRTPIPKLFINGDPSGFLIGAQREFCRAFPNQREVTIPGAHFLQEDSPEQVGKAIARFLADVRAGSLDPGRPG
jgi:haloalkane dehalogenase